MQFDVMYEIPPMRGFFHTVVNADSASDAEQKIRSIPETVNYRIKRINKIIKFEVIKDIYWEIGDI